MLEITPDPGSEQACMTCGHRQMHHHDFAVGRCDLCGCVAYVPAPRATVPAPAEEEWRTVQLERAADTSSSTGDYPAPAPEPTAGELPPRERHVHILTHETNGESFRWVCVCGCIWSRLPEPDYDPASTPTGQAAEGEWRIWQDESGDIIEKRFRNFWNHITLAEAVEDLNAQRTALTEAQRRVEELRFSYDDECIRYVQMAAKAEVAETALKAAEGRATLGNLQDP